MRLYAPDGSEMMQVSELVVEDGKLLIKGKVFGAMPMTAALKPAEARAALKLLNGRILLFLLTILFRR
jgi:hypothetical protein